MTKPGEIENLQDSTGRWKPILRNTGYILAALFIFLFTLDLMIASVQHLGKDADEFILQATSNPFTALFIGLLVTALIQSSSATTSMAVALVASGSISLQGAIPIIMGANVGTTITSTIVSLGFISKKKEFRRAITIATFHDFFNILSVVILFPLEYYFNFLSTIAHSAATTFFNEPIITSGKGNFSLLGQGFSPVINFIVNLIDNGFILAVISIALLFGSILFFRKVLSHVLGFGSQERFQRFFFRSSLKSFGWGLLTTAAIRSSTVTISLVVPLVAKRVVKIRAAVPFILGANIGTTITAFIAAMFNSNAAISIAIAHFLFNAIGVIIFTTIPFVKELPLRLAQGLGKLTLKYRLAGFLYLLLTFFVIPFSLIYINKDSGKVQELTYQKENLLTQKKSEYTLIVKTYRNQALSNWLQYDSTSPAETRKIHTIYRRKNLLVLDNDVYELNKPGFCRDGEDGRGVYSICIKEILPVFQPSKSISCDSVFVFEKSWINTTDSLSLRTYIDPRRNLLVKQEWANSKGRVLEQETLLEIREK